MAADKIRRWVRTPLIDLGEPKTTRANRFALLAFVVLLAAAAATLLGRFGFAALAAALGALLLAFASITASAAATARATAQQDEHNEQRLAALQHVASEVGRLVETIEAQEAHRSAPFPPASQRPEKPHSPERAPGQDE